MLALTGKTTMQSASKQIPYVKYTLWAALVLLLTAGITSNFFVLLYGTAQQAVRSSRPITVTHIAGVKYAIPRDYILWGLRDVENGFLVGGILPEMLGVRGDLERHHHTYDQEILISTTDARSTTSFQYRLGVERKLYEGYTYLGEGYGLRHYRANNSYWQYKPTDDPLYKHEIYADADADESTSILIDCSGEKSDLSPGCNMRFVDHDLLYEINFRKTHLSEWQSIKEKTLKLVDSFRSKNPSVQP
jgi:hypothetical protein